MGLDNLPVELEQILNRHTASLNKDQTNSATNNKQEKEGTHHQPVDSIAEQKVNSLYIKENEKSEAG